MNISQKKTDAIQNIMKQYRFFANSLALTVGAYLVISGELTLGSMIAASLLMSRTTQPVDGAVSTMSRGTIVKEAFWRIEKMLNISLSNRSTLVTEDRQFDNRRTNNTIEKIVLKNVTVSYAKMDQSFWIILVLSLGQERLSQLLVSQGLGKPHLLRCFPV